MSSEILKDRDFSGELTFTFSRSSGPGGQHANKVSTKVELRFDVSISALLAPEEKELILEKLKNKINSEGELILVSQSERSQAKNREVVIAKFYDIIDEALTPEKKRKPTKLPKAIKEKRLKEKKIRSEKKKRRSDEDIETDE